MPGSFFKGLNGGGGDAAAPFASTNKTIKTKAMGMSMPASLTEKGDKKNAHALASNTAVAADSAAKHSGMHPMGNRPNELGKLFQTDPRIAKLLSERKQGADLNISTKAAKDDVRAPKLGSMGTAKKKNPDEEELLTQQCLKAPIGNP